MKAHHVILTTLGAFTLGASLALLLAPEKGSDTRRMIKKYLKKHCPCSKKAKIEELADKIEDELQEAKASL